MSVKDFQSNHFFYAVVLAIESGQLIVFNEFFLGTNRRGTSVLCIDMFYICTHVQTLEASEFMNMLFLWPGEVPETSRRRSWARTVPGTTAETVPARGAAVASAKAQETATSISTSSELIVCNLYY